MTGEASRRPTTFLATWRPPSPEDAAPFTGLHSPALEGGHRDTARTRCVGSQRFNVSRRASGSDNRLFRVSCGQHFPLDNFGRGARRVSAAASGWRPSGPHGSADGPRSPTTAKTIARPDNAVLDASPAARKVGCSVAPRETAMDTHTPVITVAPERVAELDRLGD